MIKPIYKNDNIELVYFTGLECLSIYYRHCVKDIYNYKRVDFFMAEIVFINYLLNNLNTYPAILSISSINCDCSKIMKIADDASLGLLLIDDNHLNYILNTINRIEKLLIFS